MNKLSYKDHYLTKVVIGYFKHYVGILIGLAVICILLSILSPAFLTTRNFFNVCRQVSINANLAFGMTLAILLAGIDLSVGSVLALGGTLAAGLIVRNGLPVYVAVLIGVAIGTFCGLFNGVVIAKTGMPPFIVTLAMMQIARGAAFVYTNGQPIRVSDGPGDTFNAIGANYLGPLPLPVIYSAIIFFLIWLLLNRTKIGRYIFAVGGNPRAAEYSGINQKKVIMLSYTVIGFLAAFSGIVLCSRMFSGQPTVGEGYELDAIAAVVLGGTSFSGGVGRIGGTILGALLMGFLNNGLNLLNINSFWQLIVKGVVILLAVYVDIIKNRKQYKQ